MFVEAFIVISVVSLCFQKPSHSVV